MPETFSQCINTLEDPNICLEAKHLVARAVAEWLVHECCSQMLDYFQTQIVLRSFMESINCYINIQWQLFLLTKFILGAMACEASMKPAIYARNCFDFNKQSLQLIFLDIETASSVVLRLPDFVLLRTVHNHMQLANIYRHSLL